MNWKAVVIMISFITLLWGIILFVPREGGSANIASFWLLAGVGMGLDLFIVYVAMLRQWAKTWIQDGVIHSDMTLGSLVPLSRSMPLEELQSISFIYNGQVLRKGIANPHAKKIKEMKDQLAVKLDEVLVLGHLPKPVTLEDERYKLTLNCGVLLLRDRQERTMGVYLNMYMRQANLSQVGKFLDCLPEGLSYNWRFGKIGVHSFGSGF